MPVMTAELESDLAWRLVGQHRVSLTEPELTVVVVRLGIGEYHSAISLVLRALARERAVFNAPDWAAVNAWAYSYGRQSEVGEFLDRLRPFPSWVGRSGPRTNRGPTDKES